MGSKESRQVTTYNLQNIKKVQPVLKKQLLQRLTLTILCHLHCIQSCQISVLFIEHLSFNSTSGLKFSGHLLLLSFAFITHYSLTQSISLNMASKSYKTTTNQCKGSTIVILKLKLHQIKYPCFLLTISHLIHSSLG